MAISGTLAAEDAVNLANPVFGLDLGATGTFAAVSTWLTTVTTSGGEAPTAEMVRFAGEPIVSVGRKGARTITVTAIYDNASTGVFQNVYAAHEAATAGRKCDVQWTAFGATAGDPRFTSVNGLLTSCTLPDLTASEANPATFQFVIFASAVELDDVPA
jgi:hypothetical protein